MVTPDFQSWLEYGIEEGFCTPIYCANHELASVTDQEEFEENMEAKGMDFCWPIVRVYAGTVG
jgi:hypothetical protein